MLTIAEMEERLNMVDLKASTTALVSSVVDDALMFCGFPGLSSDDAAPGCGVGLLDVPLGLDPKKFVATRRECLAFVTNVYVPLQKKQQNKYWTSFAGCVHFKL
jgi:hypothetical protein